MRDIRIDRERVNVEALHADLRDLLDTLLVGISLNREGVTVHLRDDITEDDLMRVEERVIAHDPDLLTDSQRARLVRRAALEQARQDFTTPLDPQDFPDTLPVIRTLMRRIAWLEREIRDLREL